MSRSFFMVLLDLPFQCLEHGEDFAEEAVPGEKLGTKALEEAR